MSFDHSLQTVAAGGVTAVLCVSLVGGFVFAFVVGYLIRRVLQLLVDRFIKPPKDRP